MPLDGSRTGLASGGLPGRRRWRMGRRQRRRVDPLGGHGRPVPQRQSEEVADAAAERADVHLLAGKAATFGLRGTPPEHLEEIHHARAEQSLSAIKPIAAPVPMIRKVVPRSPPSTTGRRKAKGGLVGFCA